MPAPARTSREEILASARAIVDEHGLEGLTMQAIADAVGVKAPSLYKRVDDRADLVRSTVEDVAADLGDRLAAVPSGPDPAADLVALAEEFRAFAHEHPVAHALPFTRLPDGSHPDPTLLAQASRPVVDAAGRLAGQESALQGARTLVAWARGFVGMELAGAFRLGGEVEQAWTFGLDRVVHALAEHREGGS